MACHSDIRSLTNELLSLANNPRKLGNDYHKIAAHGHSFPPEQLHLMKCRSFTDHSADPSQSAQLPTQHSLWFDRAGLVANLDR